MELLRQVAAPVVGTVLNGVPGGSSSDRYVYGGYATEAPTEESVAPWRRAASTNGSDEERFALRLDDERVRAT